MALSFGDDNVSAASETFIVSLSSVSDILIAMSYWEMLANTENLKEKNIYKSVRVIFSDKVTRKR